MSTLRTPARHLWGWPIALAVASAVGLVTALVGDGISDGASWVGLGLPVLVCAWCGLRRRAASG